MIWTYTLIFLLAAIPFFEIMVIVPIAIVGGLPSAPVMIVAFLGNLLTIILLVLFIDKIKQWRQSKKDQGKSNSKRQKRAKNIWTKYGLPGLTFIGPFFVGSHLSALLAITFGGEKKRTLYWMTSSLLCWTLVLGISAQYGFDFFFADIQDSGFITKFLNQ